MSADLYCVGSSCSICPQHLRNQYWNWSNSCGRCIGSYFRGFRSIFGDVPQSKDLYCNNGFFYNYHPYTCDSLHTILVYFTDCFCFPRSIRWWCCLLGSYRWICSRYGNRLRLETFIKAEHVMDTIYYEKSNGPKRKTPLRRGCSSSLPRSY